MLIRDLPDQELGRRLVEGACLSWPLIENMEVEEAIFHFLARLEDLLAQSKRMQRRGAVERELADLIRPICDQYPGILVGQVEGVLHGGERERYQALIRELKEMSQVTLATRNRQPWHGAVEEEIYSRREPFRISDIVEAVLKREPSYPRTGVESYVRHIVGSYWGLR
jgi:hypothetical protein